MKRAFRAPPLAMLVLVFFVVGATASHAQFGGRGGMGGMGGGGGSRGANRDSSSSQSIRQPQPAYDSYEQVEYRLSLLEDDLHLQPGQRAAWTAFADKIRAFANDIARAKTQPLAVSAAAGAGMRFIDQATEAARNRVTALEDIALAAKTLYAALAPNQVTLADLRMPSIVAPQPRADTPAGTNNLNGNNLPDLGSSGRTQR